MAKIYANKHNNNRKTCHWRCSNSFAQSEMQFVRSFVIVKAHAVGCTTNLTKPLIVKFNLCELRNNSFQFTDLCPEAQPCASHRIASHQDRRNVISSRLKWKLFEPQAQPTEFL